VQAAKAVPVRSIQSVDKSAHRASLIPQVNDYMVSFTYNSTMETVTVSIEVVKVWLLSLHGVKFKRVTGSGWLYKQLYTRIVDALKIV
jgi:hypothetical protein